MANAREPIIRAAFPTPVLPEPVGTFVRQAASGVGCDTSYVALPTLVTLAGCIGTTRRIKLRSGWKEYPILWAAIVGDSGTAKSPAFRAALADLRAVERDSMERNRELAEQYDGEMVSHSAALARWKQKQIGDPPVPPKRPRLRRLLADDATVEGLAVLLQDNPRGITLARDELAGLFRDFDKYRSGKGGDAARWLSFWTADPLTIDRKGSMLPVYAPAAAVSIVGGVQPGILQRVMAGEHTESGMLARFLLAYPERRVKTWNEAELDPAISASVTRLYRGLLALQHDDAGRPVDLPFTEGGKRAWLGFYAAHNEEAAALTGAMAAAYSKLEAYGARLSLLFHLVRCVAGDDSIEAAGAVDSVDVAAAIQCVRWFADEADRVYRIMGEADDERHRRQLVELVKARGGTITVDDLRRSRSRFRTADDARGALLMLAHEGYGVMDRSTGPKGGRPVERFILSADHGGPPETLGDLEIAPAGDAPEGFRVVSGKGYEVVAQGGE